MIAYLTDEERALVDRAIEAQRSRGERPVVSLACIARIGVGSINRVRKGLATTPRIRTALLAACAKVLS